MGDVPAGRVTRDKHPGEVGRLGEPGVCGGLGAEPLEGGDGVVDGGGEAVLGSEAVVGGDDEGAEVGGEAKAVVLAVGPGAGADAEAAAVEVEEDGEPALPGGLAATRAVEAEVEGVGGGGEEDVLPLDGTVVDDGDGEAGVLGPDDGAVAEHAEDASALVDHTRRSREGGCHGRIGDGKQGIRTAASLRGAKKAPEEREREIGRRGRTVRWRFRQTQVW